MEEFLKVVQCPYCQGEIKIVGDGWRCFNCSRVWSVDSDGIIRLREDNVFFGNNQEEMNVLLSEIRKILSWQKFKEKISELEKKYSDFNYDYCLNPKRADWTFIGNFSDKIIVDLGAGYGSCSIPIAKKSKLVIPVEACLERIKFLSLIAKLKNIQNILPIHGDVINLPFKKNSIDSFIMIGLLEYFSNKQEQFLNYLRQFLKPEGEVWVGIENKLSLVHFFGGTYHESELPFEPLLPRLFAGLLHRIVRGKPLETQLRTKAGYSSLLKRIGFKDIEFYYAFPNYKNVKFISSSDKTKIISNYLERRKWERGGIKTRIGTKAIRMLDKLNLAGFFAPSFFIRAKKSVR